MPIIDDQRRLAEVGRIRLGRQLQTRSGKKYPAALDAFRLTSRDRSRIEDAAKLYGGTMTKWDESPSGIPEWEVYTEADRLPVIVPPSAMAFSQNYELWSGGGCQRRCDGVTEYISEQPCLCDPENRQCEPHTRLSVMLRDLKGLGVWRVDTTGYYAKLELKGQVETIEFFAGRGMMLPAILRLDQRSIKRPNEPLKRFVVPVLDVDVSPGELLMGTVAVAPEVGITLTQPALTPVPDNGIRPKSIADQVKASEAIPSRRRATPIPATGIAPRTAAQAHQQPPHGRAIEDAVEEDREQRGDPADGAGFDETRAYDDAVDAAREAQKQAAATQDPPRMSTRNQLTKLNILLNEMDFKNTKEGKREKLDWCMAAVRTYAPSPWADRTIDSSAELTFHEAATLIEVLESDKDSGNTQEQKSSDAEPDGQQTNQEEHDDPGAAQLIAGLDPEPDDSDGDAHLSREPGPGQMNLI